MTEINPEPIPPPALAQTPADPQGFGQDQRVYLFVVACAFLITGAALFFMALVDALVTELAILLLGLGALSSLLTAARLAKGAGAARVSLLRASERRLTFALGALLLSFICSTLGCGVTLELKGYGQDAGSEQDQAAIWRRT